MTRNDGKGYADKTGWITIPTVGEMFQVYWNESLCFSAKLEENGEFWVHSPECHFLKNLGENSLMGKLGIESLEIKQSNSDGSESWCVKRFRVKNYQQAN